MENMESDESDSDSFVVKKKVAKKPNGTKTDKPLLTKQISKEGKMPVFDMVKEAIETVGVPRKGASAQAIKKYVHEKREDDGKRLDTFIKNALLAGVEQGVFKKTNKGQTSGAVGSFALVKKPPKTQNNVKKKMVKDPNGEGYTSDSEMTFLIARPKPRKRNLSDSEIKETTSTPKPGLKTLKPPRAILKPVKAVKSKGKKVNESKESLDSEVTKKAVKLKGKKANESKESLNSEVTKKAVKLKGKKVNERQESSDTEVVVKPKMRKSIKSHSSDTELNFVTIRKTTTLGKKTRATENKTGKKGNKIEKEDEKDTELNFVSKKKTTTQGKKTKAAENKTEKDELPPKKPKLQYKKLHNSVEKEEKKTTVKGGKAKKKM